MDQLREKRHKYNEGWSDRELFSKLKTSTKLTILSVILSIGLIIISLVFFNKYSIILLILTLLSASLSLLLCGLIFYWFNKSNIQAKQDQVEQEVLELDQNLSVLVFIGSFLVILFNVFLLIYIAFSYKIQQHIHNANVLEITNDGYMNDFKYGLYFGYPLIILLTLTFMYIAFTSYITIQRKTKLRTCIYVFALTTIIAASFAVYFTNQAISELGQPFSPITNTILLNIFQIFAYIIIFVAIVAFFVAFTHRHLTFETVGYVNLLLIFLIVGVSYGIVRQNQEVRLQYFNGCGQQMRNTHESWIKQNTQCQKYLTTNNCDSQAQAIYWESDNTQKCLNTLCCDAFADSISTNLYHAVFAILLLILSGFALSMSLLQVDTSVSFQIESNRTIDWIFIFLGIVVLVLSVLLMVQINKSISQQDNVILTNQISIKANHNPLTYPTGIENVTGCEPFINVYKKLNGNQDLTLNGQSRVTILAPKLQVVVTEYKNSPKVSYIPKLILKNILYTQATDQDDIFGIEGDAVEIKDLLQKTIQICGNGQKNIQTDIYKLDQNTRRLLWNKHRHHEADNQPQFTDAQKQYISNLQFINLDVRIKDISNNQQIEDVALYFYKNEDDCGKIKSIPQRMINLKQNTILYNMVYKQYYFGAEKKGYYLYCNKFQVSQTTKTLEITMIPRNQQPGQFTVVLETPKHTKFNEILGASYKECRVGFFNQNCGGMQFFGSDNAQAIQINQLAERDYTFFVQFDPTDAQLKELNRNKSAGKTIDTSKIDNDPVFNEIKPIVTLYAQEQERPIIRYSLPQVTNLKNEPNLTWLVLCVDGRIGDISQKSPATFWTYNTAPNNYQRSIDSKEIYPQVCNQNEVQKTI